MKYQELIERMTLEQKAAFMSGKSTWESWNFDELIIPSLFFADGPHGLRKQEGASDHLGLNKSVPATCFPTAATLANSWSEDICQRVGEAIGLEAATNQVDVLLGPGMNIKRNPMCGRNFEYYSEDPYQTGKLAAAFIRGVQSQGVAATPKHFAVNSQELKRMSSDSIVDERTLREIYTTAFEIAVKEAKPLALMTSYNKINHTYANEHTHLLQDLLREEWEYNGLVVTDWGGSNSHIDAVKVGSHLAMPSFGLNGQREIIEAIQQGELDEAVLDQRVDELLSVVFTLAEARVATTFDQAEHHRLAQEAAENSIVLLKNQDQILPLDTKQSVAIIGEFAENPRYQGAGSSVVNPTALDTTMGVIADYPLNVVGFAKGYHRIDQADEQLVAEAVELAKTADTVILYIGLGEIDESEGLDRRTISLPQNQLHLLRRLTEVHNQIVVVLSAGSVVEMNWDVGVAAVVHGYLSGQAGARAMLNVLTGKINPSGKLSETYPFALEDVPSSADYPADSEYALYKEGLYVGYRYFETAQKPVKYCFGYGLSYTQFVYSDLTVDKTGASFTIKNIGTYSGAEVAQLYISHTNTGIYRAKKELKGFKKVTIAAGEEQRVTIPFDDKTFRYFNIETNQWEVEGGTYHIIIAANVQDEQLVAEFEVEGTTTVVPSSYQHLPHYVSGNVSDVTNEEFATLLGRETPVATWEKGQPLQVNDAISQLKFAKSGLARLINRILEHLLKKAEQKGKPDLNLLFIYNMPFRALAKMTNGMIDMPMVEGIITIVNGQFMKGCSILWKAYRAKRQYEKAHTLTK